MKNNAELLFYNTMLKRGCKAAPSSREEDMFDHIDYYVDGVTYDVKDEKKLNRWDEKASDIIWVELMNVRGNPGWLRGKADKIAFLSKDRFLVVDREALLGFVKEEIKDRNIYTAKQHKKLYRRPGRLDMVSYFHTDEIRHLVENEIFVK